MRRATTAAGALLLSGLGLLPAHRGQAQAPNHPPRPVLSVRLSVLLAPFTPLLTVETRTLGPLTLQAETNFAHTHGLNVKWFLGGEPLRGDYLLLGSAWVRNRLLRADNRPTVLPYAGYGYAWAVGSRGVFDARAGLGPALNADAVRVYPVIKVGAGLKF